MVKVVDLLVQGSQHGLGPEGGAKGSAAGGYDYQDWLAAFCRRPDRFLEGLSPAIEQRLAFLPRAARGSRGHALLETLEAYDTGTERGAGARGITWSRS